MARKCLIAKTFGDAYMFTSALMCALHRSARTGMMQTRCSHPSLAQITQDSGSEAEVSCPLIQCPPTGVFPFMANTSIPHSLGAMRLGSWYHSFALCWETSVDSNSGLVPLFREFGRWGQRRRQGDSYWSLSCGWDLNPHPKLRFGCSSKNPVLDTWASAPVHAWPTCSQQGAVVSEKGFSGMSLGVFLSKLLSGSYFTLAYKSESGQYEPKAHTFWHIHLNHSFSFIHH